MIPLTWDGNQINDGSTYRSVIIADTQGLPSVKVSEIGRGGRWPYLGGIERPGAEIALDIAIVGGAAEDARDDLLRWFDPDKDDNPGPRMLGVTDLDGSNPRFIYAICKRLRMVKGSGGLNYVAGLVIHDDIRYRASLYAEEAAVYMPFGGLTPAATNFDIDVRAWGNKALGEITGGVIGRPGKYGQGAQVAEAVTNMITNPSFETNTTGWSTAGSNTIAQSTDQALYGSNSLICTYQDNTILARYAITLTAAAHGYSIDIYVPSDWDGGTIQIYFENFAGITGGSEVSADMDKTDQWQRVTVNGTPDAGDLSGHLTTKTTSAPTAGKFIYLDAAQCEAKAYSTPYCDGSLGNGHSWKGSAHASTSERDIGYITIDTPALSKSGTISFWANIIGHDPASGFEYLLHCHDGGNQYIYASCLNASGNIRYRVGDNPETGYSAVSFGEDTHIAIVWDNGNQYLYVDGVLDRQDTYTADDLSLPDSFRIGASANTTSGAVVSDFAWIQRALSASEIAEIAARSEALGKRQYCGITASGDTFDVSNGGEDDAYPVCRISPTTTKTDNYAYKRWLAVKWNTDKPAARYPTDVTGYSLDTATLVSGGKMQADGDDLRIFVDGVEVDRWLRNINAATTGVWCNLDWQPKQETTLKTAIAGSGTLENIEVKESIVNYPSSGILLINSEAFTYTAKSDSLKRFSGITRGAKGTSEAAHSVNDDVTWIQHDIWLYYGNGSASAPSVDDDDEPMHDYTVSQNSEWDYKEFGTPTNIRPWEWARNVELGYAYTKARYGFDSPEFRVVGLGRDPAGSGFGTPGDYRWYLYNPCGITDIDLFDGDRYAVDLTAWDYRIQSSEDGGVWNDDFTIPAPGSASTWQVYTNSGLTITSDMYYIALFWAYAGYKITCCEFSQLKVTLNDFPTVTIGGEQSNYELDATLTNKETGESLDVVAVMALDETIEIDTENKTMTDLSDNSNILAGLSVVDGPRLNWLRLKPGTNEIEYTETGAAGLTLILEWFERHYN